MNRYQVKKAGGLTMPGQKEPMDVYEVALVRTAPFIEKEEKEEKEKEGDVSSAFKEVAERLKARLKDR